MTFESVLLKKMMIAIQRGSPIARQARLLLGFCQRSKPTQFLKTSNRVCRVLEMSVLVGECGKLLSQVDIGGNTRSFQVGFVSQEKGGSSSNDAEDKFKDDKFKDDPDVRGILGDIKSHFDETGKGVNVPAKPDEESVVNEDNDESESKAKEKEGSGGAKNMKQLLEKIYGARIKAAAETSVGNDPSLYFVTDNRGYSQEVIQNTAMQTPELFWTLMRRERPLEEQSRFCFD